MLLSAPASAIPAENTTQEADKPAPVIIPAQTKASETYSKAPIYEGAELDTRPSCEKAQEQSKNSSNSEIPESARNLSLEDAESMALNNSPTLRSSQWSIKAAQDRTEETLSTIYPTVSFSADLSHSGTIKSKSSSVIVNTTDTGTGSMVIDGGSRSSTSRLGATLSVRQVLMDLARKSRLRQSELSEAISMASFEAARQDVILQTRKAWFAAYIDQCIVDIRKEAIANKELRLEQAKAMYKNGTKARIDIATAETDLANANLQLIQAETMLKLDWVSLNAIMGLTEDEPYRLIADPYWEQMPELDDTKLVNAALSLRPELLSLQAQLRSQLTQLEIINASGKPSLSASASFGGSGSLTPLDYSWSVGIGLNWTIFDGYLREFETSEATASAHALAESFEQKRIDIYKEVASTIVALRQAGAERDAAEAALAKAKENYRLASARYKVGVGSSIEVSDAELSLSLAETEAATASNKIRTAKADLIRAIGADDLENLPEAEIITPDPLPDEHQERNI